ncbi:YcxB family protein [Oscillibacter sp.]|uniref:YcxB family protein n=1 Tax=Oscillibacter sp. TaxID=1945593 RepID=UPI002636DCDA|nr:YcxB family protein [Oscillibacter sp.]MDD3347673.1 YcxB family protein [Oscillibacter sp.]
MRYAASIQHSEETFLRLSKIQYDAFCGGRKGGAIVLALAAFFCGVFGGLNSALSMLLVFAACWMLVSLGLPARRNGEKMIRMAKGNYPETFYTFEPEEIKLRCGNQELTVGYRDVYAFFEDGAYFCFFLNRQSGYLVPKAALQPKKVNEFRDFMQKKTGLSVEQTAPLGGTGVKALLLRRKNRQLRKDGAKGAERIKSRR